MKINHVSLIFLAIVGQKVTTYGTFSIPMEGPGMDTDITLLQNLAPDVLKIIRQRYSLLEQIALDAPVGRRIVAQKLGLSERTVRTETDYLRQLGLVSSNKAGMFLTDKGESTLRDVIPLIDQLFNTSIAERKLAKKLGIERVIIAPGDSDLQARAFDLMGEELNNALDLLLPLGHSIITILGGATVATAAKHLSSKLSNNRQLEFIPGRGALGESVQTQSNTIVQAMADRTGGTYKTLYLPENVSDEAYRSLIRDPQISNVLVDISRSDAVIHGIGIAEEMAKRRNFSPIKLSELRAKGAVAECFGCFFNDKGEIVERLSRVGLEFENLSKIPHVFAYASGAHKAKAIVSYMKSAPRQTWLITDEGASNLILSGMSPI